MSLRAWLDEGRLRPHRSTPQEISALLRVVDRDLKDARLPELSLDRKFVTAYNACLQLATIVIRYSGYRTSGRGHHWTTFQVLPELLGESERERADFFDSCRRRRNMADYNAAGAISETEVRALLEEAAEFRTCVLDWLDSDRHEPPVAEP